MNFFLNFDEKINRTKFIVLYMLSFFIFYILDEIWQNTIVENILLSVISDDDLTFDIYLTVWILYPIIFWIQMMLEIKRFNDTGSNKAFVYITFISSLIISFWLIYRPEAFENIGSFFSIIIITLACIQIYVMSVCIFKKGKVESTQMNE